MTTTQKQRTLYLRSKGESYSAIATSLNVSENTVKSFCRRNNLGADYIRKQSVSSTDSCENCGRALTHTQGAKKKRFCTDRCRLAWWNAHPEAVNRKSMYGFVCPICGVAFEAYGNAHRKYCSRACFGAAKNRNVRCEVSDE